MLFNIGLSNRIKTKRYCTAISLKITCSKLKTTYTYIVTYIQNFRKLIFRWINLWYSKFVFLVHFKVYYCLSNLCFTTSHYVHGKTKKKNDFFVFIHNDQRSYTIPCDIHGIPNIKTNFALRLLTLFNYETKIIFIISSCFARTYNYHNFFSLYLLQILSFWIFNSCNQLTLPTIFFFTF